MASQVISNPENSTTITVKTMTGKTFEIVFATHFEAKTIDDVKKWITNNNGIAAEYQELFEGAAGGKKMVGSDLLTRMTCKTLHLAIKPMPKFELVIYCYAFFKINAASAWTIWYLYKALAEATNFQSEDQIEIDVQYHSGRVSSLHRSSKTLDDKSIDHSCILKVFRRLSVSVTENSGEKKQKTVRIHNKLETVKDLLKKLRKEYKLPSKTNVTCKGDIIPHETRLIELGFEQIEVAKATK